MAGGATIDPQAIGWRDDGHESGVLRTERVRGGDLVRVPLRDGQFTYNGSSTSMQRGSWQENSDGTGSGMLISVTAGATAPAIVEHLFTGRVYGVRTIPAYNNPNIGPGITDFSVMIDGKAYAVEPYRRRVEATGVDTMTTGEAAFIVADDLPPGLHRATLVFPPHPTINARWALLGYVAEKAAGYSEPGERLSLFGAPTVLTTSAADIRAMLSGTSAKAPRGVRGGLLFNSTAAAVTVTLSLGSTDIYSVSVPANGSAQFTFPGLIGNVLSDIKLRASASSAVTVTLVEGL
jgi:hypothetical protein